MNNPHRHRQIVESTGEILIDEIIPAPQGRLPSNTFYMKEYVKALEFMPVLNPTEQQLYRRAKLDAQSDTGRFYLNKTVKEEVAEAAGRSPDSVKRAVRSLKRSRLILADGSPGTYMLNPYFGWKGGDASRRATLSRLERDRVRHLPAELEARVTLVVPFS